MKRSIVALPLIAIASPALADGVTFKPLIDARLRLESVDQAGVPEQSDALTLRLRAGGEVKSGDFAVLVEGEATAALSSTYNSGLNGKGIYPIVADPQNIDLNRAQVQFTGVPKTVLTLGRQRINLDDQRFVGTVLWRQNEQTYDAVRAEWTGIKGVKADVTYAWGVRTIWGVNGFGARQQAISGDNVFANLSYKAKTWGIAGFAYQVDQDEAVVQNFRNSSRTFGIRANASLPVAKGVKLNVLGSYATQSDFHRNPNDYAADYFAGEAVLDLSGPKLTAGFEVLGADSGLALTSFQTPLATLHKFNGFADKFLVTPPNGLRDIYFGAGYALPKAKLLPGFNINLTWHQFKSDRLNQKYGNEWNAVGGFKIGKKVSLLAKYANYRRSGAANFAGDADTRKYWVELDYAF